MDSQKFRKHPGGIASWIKWVKWWVMLVLFGSAVMVPFSIFLQFNDHPIIDVVQLKNKSSLIETSNYLISGANMGELKMLKYNFFDSIVCYTFSPTSLFASLFSFLIAWQLYLIFKKLEMARPFHKDIPKRIQYIGIILIAISIISFLRVFYMDYIVSDLTDHTFKVNFKLYVGDINSFKVGILVLIIAAIYKQGFKLQQDQDLTI